jgi:hypothetical protein
MNGTHWPLLCHRPIKEVKTGSGSQFCNSYNCMVLNTCYCNKGVLLQYFHISIWCTLNIFAPVLLFFYPFPPSPTLFCNFNGFHYAIFIHAYNVLPSYSPPHHSLLSPSPFLFSHSLPVTFILKLILISWAQAEMRRWLSMVKFQRRKGIVTLRNSIQDRYM